LFGIENIDYLPADLEFNSQNWLSQLNLKRIKYYIRIKENFWVDIPRNGHKVKAFWLFNSLSIYLHKFYRHIVRITKGQLCSLSASRLLNKKGKPELQIIVSFSKPEEANSLNKKRWGYRPAIICSAYR
jgi:hypothetical protein